MLKFLFYVSILSFWLDLFGHILHIIYMNEVIGKYPFECIQYVTILIDHNKVFLWPYQLTNSSFSSRNNHYVRRCSAKNTVLSGLLNARAHADEWHLFHQPQKRTGARDVKPKEAHSDSFSYLQNEAAGPTQRP